MKFRLRPCDWSQAKATDALFDASKRTPSVLYDVELKTGYFFWRKVASNVTIAQAQTAMTEIQTAYLTYEIK